MKYGIVFPQTEFPADANAIRDFTQTAEALGFNHILAYDHILGANPDRPGGWAGPYTFRDPFEEPLTLFSFMAGITTTISFITGIIILPQRQTALFAKQAATLDVLSQGRLRIGVALGWNEVEYVALNQDFHTRAKRFEEQVELLRQLWTKPLVTYQGRWHTIPDAGLNPLPIQQPIPLWFGGHADSVLQRVARFADGWLPNYRTAAEAAPALESLAGYLERYGRTLDQLGIEPRLRYGEGDVSAWLSVAAGWEAAGATHLTLNTMGAGFSTADAHIAAMRHFAREMPLQNAP